MDCTTIGFLPPMATPPTTTWILWRRILGASLLTIFPFALIHYLDNSTSGATMIAATLPCQFAVPPKLSQKLT
jgi:hypothetical protein